MRLQVAFTRVVGKWSSNDEGEVCSNLSVFRGFIVSLHIARKTRKASLRKWSWRDKGLGLTEPLRVIPLCSGGSLRGELTHKLTELDARNTHKCKECVSDASEVVEAGVSCSVCSS